MAKTRSDRNSVSGALDRARAAQDGLARWPASVPRQDDEEAQSAIDDLFAKIAASRPAADWSHVELARCAHLAVLMHLVGKDMALLARTGTLTRGDRGLKPTPVLYAIEKVQSQISLLCRHLGLTLRTDGKGDLRDRAAGWAQFETEHGRYQSRSKPRPTKGKHDYADLLN